MAKQGTQHSKLVAVGLLLLLPVVGLALLMPALSSARLSGLKKSLLYRTAAQARSSTERAGEPTPAADQEPAVPQAVVKTFDAEINLTPRLSVGTATPESIYLAEFTATIEARAPGEGQEECQIELPLPPQIISLADVVLKANDEPTEDFVLTENRLVWRGSLDPAKSASITVAYSATGKGIYTLEKPSGKIIEHFQAKLIANRSNIRMLELSLQPNKLEQTSDKTTYTWDYERLVVARPIAVDVLGIAAIDRLGELTWLAPVSALAFGILIALVALAHDPEKLNGWLVILVVGCFAGAYPMMYFLQDFVSLSVAIALAAVGVLAVTSWRVISLFGLKQGLFGGVVLPAVVMALTIASAVQAKRAMQGVLLTALAIFGLIVAMVVLPKAQANLMALYSSGAPSAPEGGGGTQPTA